MAIVSLGLIVWGVRRCETPSATTPASAESLVVQPSSMPVAPRRVDVESSTPGDSDPEDRRVARAGAVYSGYVVDASGAALPRCLVTWTSLDLSTTPSVDEIRGATIEARTDDAGRFEFSTRPRGAGSRGSVVWITHLDHVARAVSLGAVLASEVSGRTYSLRPASPVVAHVLGRGEQPAPDATVLQLPSSASVASGSPESVLVRERRTEESGLARLYPMPHSHRLSASRGAETALPWEGVARGRIVLRLGPTFRISGRIGRSSDLSDSVPLTVLVAAVDSRAPARQPLARVDAGADEWESGPLPVPATGERLLVRLEGVGVVVQELELDLPVAGDELVADFTAAPGPWLWFYVVDASDESVVLTESEVTVRWEADGRAIEKTVAARDDGYIAVGGCPEGLISPTFRCPGFEQMPITPVLVPQHEEAAILIAMSPARTLTGRVTADGRPVSAFELLYWPTGQPGFVSRRAVVDSIDGRFEADDLPIGATTILASAAEIGQSVPTPIAPDATSIELELELVTGVRGRGRVVDAATGAPLTTARVHVHTSRASASLGRRGQPQPVDGSGHFDVTGLTQGEAMLSVEAPGFAPQQVVATTSRAGEVTEIGTIALVPAQELVVRLLLPDEHDPSSYRMVGFGPTPLEACTLDASGAATWESASPGDYGFVVASDVLPTIEFPLLLVSGRTWDFTVDLAGGSTLEVEIRGDDGPLGRDAMVRTIRPGDHVQRHVSLDGKERVAIPGLRPGPVRVEIVGGVAHGHEVLASRGIEIGHDGAYSLRIDLDELARVVRVVDREGEPVAGARADVFADGNPWTSTFCDERGELEIFGLDDDAELVVHLTHAQHGIRLGVVIDARPGGRPAEVVLDGTTTATLVFRSASGPAAGVAPRLHDVLRQKTLFGARSGEQGEVAFHGLTDGRYFLFVEDARYWRVEQPIDVVAGAPPHLVELVRRVPLRVRATRGGAVVSGQALELHWVDGDVSVERMIAARALSAEVAELRTDERGELALDGVPEGRYRWAASTGTEAATGSFELHGDETGAIVLELGIALD